MILLLTISMLPIVVMRIGFVRNVRALGDRIMDQSREYLTADVESKMRLAAEDYTALISGERSRMEIALEFQAAEVNRALAEEKPTPTPVYFPSDFEKAVVMSPDTILSPLHFRILPDNKTELPEVSYSHQVFWLPPDLQQEDVQSDIFRLAALTPVYKTINSHIKTLVLWHYTSLQNGLHSAYPGHGYIPRRLDPRQEPWYRSEADPEDITWSHTYVDPETRRLVLALSKPVHRPDGAFAGVTTLVVPLATILDEALLVRNIPDQTEMLLANLESDPRNGQKGLRILANPEYTDVKHRGWRTRIEPRWLEASDPAGYQAMLEDIRLGFGNTRRMPYNGRDCLWVYGSPIYRYVDGSAVLILITPYEEILRPAQAMESTINGLFDKLFYLTSFSFGGFLILVVILALAFSRRVTQPIQRLTAGAMRLAEGNFDSRVDIRSRDELGELGRLFNSVGPRLKEHYHMSQSLALAKEVQQSLIPTTDPSVEGLDVSGRLIYCDETGGDYFDYLVPDDGRPGTIRLIVGDVSDHGVQSALLMASARAFFRLRSSMPGDIAEVVGDVNRQLAVDIEETGRFMSLFACDIDGTAKTLQWVRAGHDPAILYDPAADAFDDLTGQGLALALVREFRYHASRRDLSPGQIILIGTDGIWEAHDTRGGMFGKDRLREVIRLNAEKSAREIVEAVVEAVLEFRGNAEPEDDITLVVIKVRA